MSDKLKQVASKLDEIESCITNLKDNIKNVIEYFQSQCANHVENNKEKIDGETKNEQN